MWLGGTLPWWAVAFFLAGEAAFAFSQRRGVRQVIKPVEKRAAELRLLAGLLNLFEQTPFVSERLKALQAELQVVGQPPSRRIRQLHRQIDWLNARRNQFFAPIAAYCSFGKRLAPPFVLEAWRRQVGPAIRVWLDVVGELRRPVSCPLASPYRYEHPADVFPQIEQAGASTSKSIDLGHPRCCQSGGTCELGASRRRPTPASGQRLKHVGEEHAAAHRGNQCRPRAGGGAGSRHAVPAALARCSSGAHLAGSRFAAGMEPIPVLRTCRGNLSHPPTTRFGKTGSALALFARRAAAGDQFPRLAEGCMRSR